LAENVSRETFSIISLSFIDLTLFYNIFCIKYVVKDMNLECPLYTFPHIYPQLSIIIGYSKGHEV